MVPVNLRLPRTCNCWVGSVVPIPTELTPLLLIAVITVPPIPIFKLVAVRIPALLLNTNLEDVAKSSDSLNNTLDLSPGGLKVRVALGLRERPVAVTTFPTKSNWVILLAVPTIIPSSYTLIDPGITPPPTGCQYLLPEVSPCMVISWYLVPAGIPVLLPPSAIPKY